MVLREWDDVTVDRKRKENFLLPTGGGVGKRGSGGFHGPDWENDMILLRRDVLRSTRKRERASCL